MFKLKVYFFLIFFFTYKMIFLFTNSVAQMTTNGAILAIHFRYIKVKVGDY